MVWCGSILGTTQAGDRREKEEAMASSEKHLRKALATGRRLARERLEARDEALEKRRTRMAAAAARLAVAPEMPERLVRAAGGRASAGTLIAEGDSWFHYPGNDIVDALADDYGYEVESVAHRGDRLEDMAYSRQQFDRFIRTVEKLARRGDVPRAVLLSGGGNDIAGDEFELLLDHALSPRPGLNEEVVGGIIDRRLHHAYVTLLTAITLLCERRFGRKIPVLLHGYAHAIPDGRGYKGGWGPLPGPWLRPGFRRKGFPDDPLDKRSAVVKKLIDRFNRMLIDTAGLEGFDHVRYLDLRPHLPSGADWEAWWANELHPTRKGFDAVTKVFADALDALP